MSDQILLGIAALVFTLMISGLFLTLRSAGNWQDLARIKTACNKRAPDNAMKYSVFEIGEKSILLFIGIGAFGAAALQIAETFRTLSFEIEQLFILFIYAEVIGMVGAYISSSRIPLTLPIIIAITALCRLIVMQSKETEALVLISESASILLLSGAAYTMSLKGKISLEKLKDLQHHDPS